MVNMKKAGHEKAILLDSKKDSFLEKRAVSRSRYHSQKKTRVRGDEFTHITNMRASSYILSTNIAARCDRRVTHHDRTGHPNIPSTNYASLHNSPPKLQNWKERKASDRRSVKAPIDPVSTQAKTHIPTPSHITQLYASSAVCS